MPQDAFTLRHAARELDGALAGGHINRITQQGRDEVAMLVYTGGRTVRLVLNANASDCGAYFLDGGENPLVAPNFCMLLRKHLQGGKILGVSLLGFERVLLFRILSESDFSSAEKTLCLEVMGKYSNLILTENGIVLGALKLASADEHVKRILLPGVPYSPPPPQDKADPLDEEALRLSLHGEIGENFFKRVAGIAPRTAAQIARSFRGGDPAAHVRNFLFSDDISPCLIVQDGVPVDFSARPDEGGVPYPTLLGAMTAYYSASRAAKRAEARRRALLSAVNAAVKKNEKRLGQIVERRRECAGCEQLRLQGELLIANLYAVPRGAACFEAENYVGGGRMKIALDPSLSPSGNAQSYFKRYRKQKRAAEILAPQEEETRAELDYLLSLRAAVLRARQEEDFDSLEEETEGAGLCKGQRDPRKKQKKQIPYRVYEREGFRILAGRNNLQNDRLVREASPDDLWLHARQYHSCHVVVQCGGRRPPEGVLAFAAAVCAAYSDAAEKIPVDCCAVKYVKKPPKSKAGFVVYSSFTTLLGDPSLL